MKREIAKKVAMIALAVAAGWAGATATTAAQEAAEADRVAAEVRNAALQESAALCEAAQGRWWTGANGAPKCATTASVRTTRTEKEQCLQQGGRPRRDSGVQVCDHEK